MKEEVVPIGDYETRPISDELWGLMKELRRERYRLSREAQAQGGMCVTGFAWGFLSLLAGFGNFGNPSPGADFTRLAREGTGPEGLAKYVDIAEGKGLMPVCGAMGAHLGQVYANVTAQGGIGKGIKPEFVYQPGGCHALVKGAQLCADLLGLPMLHIETPRGAIENAREYLFSQLADAIEWIEKHTGRKFDDEKFIESTINSIRARVMWAKTCELMKTVPAPMTYREAMSLRLPLVAYSYSKRTRDYMELLYAEIKERVRDGIAGTPFEKKRLMHEGLHPLYRPDILRWPEEYGAAFIWGQFFMAFGAWKFTEDGHTIAAQSLEEQGIELRSRENALHALVDIDLPLEGRFEDTESRRALYTIRMVQDWHIDGVMFHLARRCAALNGGILGRKSELMEMGIPVGTYEASEADPKEFNEIQVRENFDVFLESLGLTKMGQTLVDRDDD
jgi:benzoyl-CoA reductase subunit B